MKDHYILLRFFAIILFICLLWMSILNIAFYAKQNQIEDLIAKALNVQKVELEYFSNFPFSYLKFNYVKIELDEMSYLKVDNIKVHYNLLNFFLKGEKAIISHVDVENIEYYFTIPAIKKIIRGFKKNEDKKDLDYETQEELEYEAINLSAILPYNMEINIKNLEGFLKVVGTAGVYNQVQNAFINLSEESLYFRFTNHLHARIREIVGLTYLDFNTEIIIPNRKHTELIINTDLNQFNFWGIPLVPEKSHEFFSIVFADKFFIDTSKSRFLTKHLQKLENGYIFDFETILDYQKPLADAYHAFEYLLGPGKWKNKIYAKIVPHEYETHFSLDPLNSSFPPYYIHIDGKQKKDKFLLNGKMDAARGDMALDISFDKTSPFPSGHTKINHYLFLKGLDIGGEGTVIADKKTMVANVHDLTLTGAPVGTSDLFMEIDKNSVFKMYSKYPKNNNLSVYGVFTAGKVDLELDINNISGDLITKYVGFNLLGVKDARYFGSIFMNSDIIAGKDFSLSGDIKGYKKDKLYASAGLHFTKKDKLFEVSNISLPTFGLEANTELLFGGDRHEQKVSLQIGITRNNNEPIFGIGSITQNYLTNKSKVSLNFDSNAILVDVFNDKKNKKTNVEIDIKEYPLDKLGFSPIIDGYFNLKFQNHVMTHFTIDSNIDYHNRNYKLQLQTDPLRHNYLPVSYFNFQTDIDKKEGKGILIQNQDLFSLDVDFSEKEYLTAYYKYKGNQIKFDTFIDKFKVFFFNNEKYEITGQVKANGYVFNPNLVASLFLHEEEGNNYISLPYIEKKQKIFNFLDAKIKQENLQMLFAIYGTYTNFSVWDLEIKTDTSLFDNFKFNTNIQYSKNYKDALLSYQVDPIHTKYIKVDAISGKIDIHDDHFVFSRVNDMLGIEGDMNYNSLYPTGNLILSINPFTYIWKGKINKTNYIQNFIGNVNLPFLKASNSIKNIDGNFSFNLSYTKDILDTDNKNLSGDLLFSNLELNLDKLSSSISRPIDLDFHIKNNVLKFEDTNIVFDTGTYVVKGNILFNGFDINNINVQINPKSVFDYLRWDFLLSSIGIKGKTKLNSFEVTGTPDELFLNSDITFENTTLTLEFDKLFLPSNNTSLNQALFSFIGNINFDTNFHLGAGGKIINNLFNTTLSQSTDISLKGKLYDESLLINGSVPIVKGNFSYLQTDLDINDGSIFFSGKPMDFLPTLKINTSVTEIDENNEKVNIYLTFEGKIPKIILQDVYSLPPKSRSELLTYLGFGSSIDTGNVSDNNTDQYFSSGTNALASGVGIAENALLFSPVTRVLRQKLGLDILNVNSDIFSNFTRNALETTRDLHGVALLDGTSIEIGKYLYKGLSVSYELSLQADYYDQNSIYDRHTISIGYEFNTIGKGDISVFGKYTPIENDLNDNEFLLEIEYKKRF